MAEFCLDCWNKLNGTNDTQRDWVLSEELDLCEGCGQWKQVVVKPREHKLIYDLLHLRRSILIFAVLFLFGICCWLLFGREQKEFSYGETEYHAPCLMSLATGEIGELTVYDMDPLRPEELAAVQSVGTFSFLSCAGIMAGRDTGSHVCQAVVPSKAFVLLDLFDIENVRTYSVCDGACYTIREYRVDITWRKELDGFWIQVQGNL